MKKNKRILDRVFWLLLIASIPAGVFLVSQKTHFFQRAFGVNANLEIDIESLDTSGRSEVWRNLAQGGEDTGRQLLPVIEQTRKLRPTYIRIDHVFDYYDTVNSFSKLDEVISDILATGATPFISLSYMPSSLSRGNVTDLPENWADWENLVTKTIEHVSGRNGLNIPNVYYEVWNEPDLFGNFKTYGNKNYLELYGRTVVAAGRAGNVQPFKIGGPATTGFYENWHNRLLEYAQKNGLRLDFLSWHRYSKSIFDFEKDMDNAQRYQGYELLVTESGPNSENDAVYDNSFSAIHLLSLATLFEGRIDKLFTFEIKDGKGPDKNWGRWGLLTHEAYGVPTEKPRYHALSFLNRLIGGQGLTVNGQGSWVRAIAKRFPNKISILIVNFDDRGSHAEAVPIKLTNLPSEAFKLSQTRFLGNTPQVQDIAVVGGTWETSIYMTPNTSILLELNF